MTEAKKVSVPETPERLAIHLGDDGPGRRFLLVGGFKNQKELMKFFRTIKTPGDLVAETTGSIRAYINLEVITPEGESFYAVQFSGNADLMWKIHAEAVLAAGYPMADVREQQILIHGREDYPIPVSTCSGVLHNVRANSV